MTTVIDMHTHAQQIIQTDPGYAAWLRRLAAVAGRRGLVGVWERFGYGPGLVNRVTIWAAAPLTTFEVQLRHVMVAPERLREAMRQAGVSQAVTLPIDPLGSSDENLALGRAFPELIPFVSVHPDVPGAAQRVDDLLARGGRGVKLHPVLQEVPAEALSWHALLEAIGAHDLVVLTHTGDFSYYLRRRPASTYASPLRFERMLSAFPRQTFVLGHSGLHQFEDALALAQRHDNTVLETSFQHHTRIRRALDALGSERVVFGSDWPAGDPAVALKQARRAARSDDELERILHRNAQRLLGAVAPVSAG